ncbi:methyltransferase [Actinokineospora sp. NBRC 105648]|uniref:methyltransferase n=1 Tax=Actinokineospora sp. NBRC 105648 TaxID=3032206 RepID=UPI0024A39E44|nr:methyltransferase [Actinokineospora sp. NBRC 105648]GLZ42017.1 hydroxyneurosporene-O-methyltransferase [Actinokineospora sp. NBRC 105648]
MTAEESDHGAEAPHERMLRLHLMGGPWISQSIHVAAALGIADHLADAPVGIAELARATGAHEGALYRFCRALAGLGVLAAHPDRAFGLTDLGRTLRTDEPRTLRWGVMLHGGETFRAWGDVLHTVRTGEPAFDHVFGEPFFEYLATHPEYNEIFNRTMGVTDRPPEVLAEFDFSDARVVADIGGGIGTLIAQVLVEHPHLSGVLQDLPAGVEEAPAHLAGAGVADRCEVIGASFFDSVPQGADVYVVSRVLHNWDDDRAVELLTAVRKAMAPGGRVLVVDHLLPDESGFHPAMLADLHMLVVLGGQDRTERELHGLLERSGLRAVRSWDGPVGTSPRVDSMIEAVTAG